MVRGTKRAAADDAPAKATKVAKTEKPTKAPALSAEEFKAKALPLHLDLTHTPPSIKEEDPKDPVPIDIGHIDELTLLPSTFSTGSYGWKGSKRIIVELQGDEGHEHKEKVTVMLTVNATVLNSKPAKKGGKTSKSEEHEDEGHEETHEDGQEDQLETTGETKTD